MNVIDVSGVQLNIADFFYLFHHVNHKKTAELTRFSTKKRRAKPLHCWQHIDFGDKVSADLNQKDDRFCFGSLIRLGLARCGKWVASRSVSARTNRLLLLIGACIAFRVSLAFSFSFSTSTHAVAVAHARRKRNENRIARARTALQRTAHALAVHHQTGRLLLLLI